MRLPRFGRVVGCGALAFALMLLCARAGSAQGRVGLRGGSLAPQPPVPLRPPGSNINQPGLSPSGLLSPFSPQAGGYVNFNGSGQTGSSSFATTGSPYNGIAPYGVGSPYGGMAPYGTYPPYGVNNSYGAFSPYGAFNPFGAYNPYAAFGPFGGYNPYGTFNPYGAVNPFGGVNPYGIFNPFAGFNPYAAAPMVGPMNPAAAGINPQAGFNPFGF
jgi:hypothetical protein